MPQSEFRTYFHRRASRFNAFYRSEPVSRLLGRGPMFDRLRGAVDMIAQVGAKTVLDVGCGAGPLFEPLARRGIRVTGIDPAAAMVELAKKSAEPFGDLVTVVQEGWEQIDSVDAYDASVALGVYDYVDDPGDLMRRMGKASSYVIGSFPSPGARTGLRKVRYGTHGVHVHGYTTQRLSDLASESGLRVEHLVPLGRAGHLALFGRA